MNGQNVGYARVSSIDQNIERQTSQLEKQNLHRLFTDTLSGKSKERPALQDLLKYVRQGDHLFVHSMDRLARNLLDLIGMVKDLNNRGVKITFIKENLTFTGDDSPASVLVLQVIGAVAEFERAIIRARQADGIKIAKAKGLYKGGTPFLKQGQVIELRQMVADGIPKAKVARKFNICRDTVYKYLREENVAVS